MSEEVKTPLEWISQITELNDIHEFMQDPAVDQAMGYLIKIYMKEGLVPPAKVPQLIVELQALAGICALKAKYFTVFEKGGENSKRKNVYYTIENALDNLVNSLKYSARFGNQ